jgi:spore coat polysaccharide biosynthesis protein SpsF
MLGIIIQARLGSSRMPEKIIKPFFNNTSIIEILIQKLVTTFPNTPIIISTTTNPKDDKLVNLCERLDVKYYRGNESNVLDRIIKTALFYKLNSLIRICSDNPFILMSEIEKLIEIGNLNKYDYASFSTSDNIPSILTHYGLWAEFVKLDCLISISKVSKDPKHLEHVTNFIYSEPNNFRSKLLRIPKIVDDCKNVRLTIDSDEDFEISKEIFAKIPNSESYEEIIETIMSNKLWLQVMSSQIVRYSKK